MTAATGRSGMDENHGLASIEFFKNRRESRIPRPLIVIITYEAYSVGLKNIERISNFPQTALGIRQRYCCEQPEASRIVFHHLCRVFIAGSRQAACCFRSTKPYPWKAE